MILITIAVACMANSDWLLLVHSFTTYNSTVFSCHNNMAQAGLQLQTLDGASVVNRVVSE